MSKRARPTSGSPIAARLLDLAHRQTEIFDRLPAAVTHCGRGGLAGEQAADQAAARADTTPQRPQRRDHVQKGRKRAPVPAGHDVVTYQSLPRRPVRAESAADLAGEDRLESLPLRHDATSQGRGRLLERREFGPRLPCEPGGQIDRPGAAHTAGRPPGEFTGDRVEQFAKPSVRLQPRRRAGGCLDPVDPEDPRHLKTLRLEFPSPVAANVGIAGSVRLHEEQRPPRRESGHLTGHDPRTVFLRRRHQQQHIAGRQHRLQEVAVVVARARPRRLAVRRRRDEILRVWIGAVDEHDVGDRGRITADEPGLHHVERQPGDVDVAGGDDDWIDGRRPGDVACRRHLAASQRVDEGALARAGAADHADDEHPREFAASPVEPGRDRLPFAFHPAGRGPLRTSGRPAGQRVDEQVERHEVRLHGMRMRRSVGGRIHVRRPPESIRRAVAEPALTRASNPSPRAGRSPPSHRRERRRAASRRVSFHVQPTSRRTAARSAA